MFKTPPTTTPPTKSDETRERIFTTAIALLAEKGFDGVTMREIAEGCGMAVGAFYYYFKSKEDIILHFYQLSQDAAEAHAEQVASSKGTLQKKLSEILKFKFEQFEPYRHLLSALAKTATDPSHPLSPFSPQTFEIRNQAIGIFETLLKNVPDKISPDLESHLPRLLWMHQMSLMFFWIHDSSPHQSKTQKLLEVSVEIVCQMLKFARLPIGRSARKKLSGVLAEILGGKV